MRPLTFQLSSRQKQVIQNLIFLAWLLVAIFTGRQPWRAIFALDRVQLHGLFEFWIPGALCIAAALNPLLYFTVEEEGRGSKKMLILVCLALLGCQISLYVDVAAWVPTALCIGALSYAAFFYIVKPRRPRFGRMMGFEALILLGVALSLALANSWPIKAQGAGADRRALGRQPSPVP